MRLAGTGAADWPRVPPVTTQISSPASIAEQHATVSVLGRRVQYKYVVAVVYVTAMFIDILDATIVNVAIPDLGKEFRTESAEWVVLGYTLSLAVWIPASGWLCRASAAGCSHRSAWRCCSVRSRRRNVPARQCS